MANSKALNRVKTFNQNHQSVGIRLSTSQLRALATQLDSIPNGPDGVCFEVSLNGNAHQIEIIPYIINPNGSKGYYAKNGLKGSINVNLGRESPQSTFDLVITGDGIAANPPFGGAAPVGGAAIVAFGLTGNSQRTPPPFAP